ncbi:MAG: YraN family protein [Oscillospiraceae bacterium]
MAENIGRIGEQTASVFLKANGYKIIAMNYHSRFGEIDIIASDDKYIVFAEVKTRAVNALVSGEEAVDRRKQLKLTTTANRYLQANPTDLQPRFDVIVIEHSRSRDFRVKNHITNAF